MAHYTEADVERIMSTEGMLKSRPKIEAIINNAKAFQCIQEEFGSFCEYIWAFTNHKTIIYKGHPAGQVPVKNELSTQISKDLKKRGFKFVGPVTIYSHLLVLMRLIKLILWYIYQQMNNCARNRI